MSKCFISLNLVEKKKKGAKCNNFQRNSKKKFKKILVLKLLRLLIALKHSFKGFKRQKALFKPFDVFLMGAASDSSEAGDVDQELEDTKAKETEQHHFD